MSDRGYRRGGYEDDDLDRYGREEGYDLDDQARRDRGFGGGPGRYGEDRYGEGMSGQTRYGRTRPDPGRARHRESNLGLEKLPPPRGERYSGGRAPGGMSRGGPFDRWEGEREQTWGGRRTYSSHPDDYDAREAPPARNRSHYDDLPGSGEGGYYSSPEREQTWGGLRAYQGSGRDRNAYERGDRGGYSRQEGGSRYDAGTSERGIYRENYRGPLDRNRNSYRAGPMDEELGRSEHYHRPSSNRSDLSRWEYDRADLGYGGVDRPDWNDYEDDYRWRGRRR
jgi:hypothetical protein